MFTLESIYKVLSVDKVWWVIMQSFDTSLAGVFVIDWCVRVCTHTHTYIE